MEINICLSTEDDSYLQHVAATIASIVNNSPKNKFNIHILTDYMSEESKEKLAALENENCKINYLVVDSSYVSNWPIIWDRVKISTYYRLFISTLLPNLDKIIYLDTDIIVDEDISKLYEENIDEYYAAAVDDICAYYNFRGDDSFYANAGVMIFNLKKIRQDNIEKKFFDFLEQNRDTDLIKYMDQDILNHVLHPYIKKLHFKWNVQTFVFHKLVKKYHPLNKEIKEGLKKPLIRHFTGNEKPWVDYSVPHSDLYFKYLKKTPYKNNIKITDFIFGKIKRYWGLYSKHPFLFIKDEISIIPSIIDYKNPNIIKKFGTSKEEIFTNILKKNNFQTILNKLIKKYKDKKIIFYGAGFTCDLIFENFDIAGLNIIAVADNRFKDNTQQYKGFPCISPDEIGEKKPDVVFITTQNYTQIEDFFENELFKKSLKFKYKPIFAYSFNDFIKNRLNPKYDSTFGFSESDI